MEPEVLNIWNSDIFNFAQRTASNRFSQIALIISFRAILSTFQGFTQQVSSGL